MNCADVIRYVVEPGNGSPEVREHLERCESCRASAEESRRVAALVATLPAMERPDIAGRVMARIGYGNGRPTRDKILDQLERIREELEEARSAARPEEIDWQPSTIEPSVGRILEHLSSEERILLTGAMKAVGRGGFAAADGETSVSTQSIPESANSLNGKVLGDLEDLRRVRKWALRFISGLRPEDLGVEAAELLRSIYHHEADHAAQIADTVWRSRRIAGLSG